MWKNSEIKLLHSTYYCPYYIIHFYYVFIHFGYFRLLSDCKHSVDTLSVFVSRYSCIPIFFPTIFMLFLPNPPAAALYPAARRQYFYTWRGILACAHFVFVTLIFVFFFNFLFFCFSRLRCYSRVVFWASENVVRNLCAKCGKRRIDIPFFFFATAGLLQDFEMCTIFRRRRRQPGVGRTNFKDEVVSWRLYRYKKKWRNRRRGKIIFSFNFGFSSPIKQMNVLRHSSRVWLFSDDFWEIVKEKKDF